MGGERECGWRTHRGGGKLKGVAEVAFDLHPGKLAVDCARKRRVDRRGTGEQGLGGGVTVVISSVPSV